MIPPDLIEVARAGSRIQMSRYTTSTWKMLKIDKKTQTIYDPKIDRNLIIQKMMGNVKGKTRNILRFFPVDTTASL